MLLNFIPFVFPGIANVRCAFQTRIGGLSQGPYGEGNIAYTVGDDPLTVSANRIDLAASLELPRLAEVHQVHSDALVFDPDPVDLSRTSVPPTMPEGDGLATMHSGFGLVIKTADCQPVLIAHRNGRHIAALHVGWRGNRIAFIQSGIAAFCARYSLRPEDLSAVRGPSLGPDRSEFINFDTEWGPEFADWFDRSQQTMNLWELTRAQLRKAGLRPDRIFGLDLCTYSLPENFFSYRRERVCGRQASVIWIA